MMDRRSFLRLGSAAALGVLVGPELLVTPGPRLLESSVTLAEWARRMDPTGKSRAIVALLAETNDLLLDMTWADGR